MLSFGEGPGALGRLYGWCDAGGTLEARWRANLKIARRCQQLNDTNGAIVTAKLVARTAAADGDPGTPAPSVYSARASRYGVLGSRNLGRA